jgi:hydantoinase/carbamoylase family amidase
MTAAGVAVDSLRLLRSLEELGRIGRDADGAITRLCLTPTERAAHDLVGEWMEQAGLAVERDAFGNTIGTRPGRSEGQAIAVGSHVDSVPLGGNFDGAAGVAAAVEVVRALDDAGVVTDRAVKVVCFSAEEGARFGAPCLGSKAAVGLLDGQDLHELRDARGVTLHDALGEVGSRPDEVVGPAPWVEDVAAFLELHIEQGRVLEAAGEQAGVVDWVAGNRRLRVRVEGQTDHSGATPMRLRRDALVTASEIVLEVERVARRARELVGTVGEFRVHPGAMTAVPGRVDLSVDVRSTDVILQERAIQRVIAAAESQAVRRRVEVDVRDVSAVAPVLLPSWLRRSLADAGRKVVGRTRVMTSGAGHDAAIMARRVHAGMVFIPCRGGISHSREEWASPDHLATGTQVLAEAVVDIDRRISQFAPPTRREPDAVRMRAS